MLMKGLEEDGHDVYQSDTMIVEHASRLSAAGHYTVVVSDDTDILVLLIHYCDGQDLLHDICFLSHATKKSKAGLQVFRIRDIAESIGQQTVKIFYFCTPGVIVTPPRLHLDMVKWHS